MRFTVVLVVLCAILMVSVANKANKAKRFRKKMMMKGMKDKCSHIVTWSNCVNDKITQTVSMDMSDPACSHPIVDSQQQMNTMDCVAVTTKSSRKGCTKTFTRDFKGCENNGANFTLTIQKSAECGKKNGGEVTEKTIQLPCNRAVGMNHAKKLKSKMNKKANKGKGMMEKKKFKKALRQKKKEGCQYQPGPCDKTTNKMIWQMKSGDAAICTELESPCFMGKMKKNRRPRGGKRNA